MKYRSSLLVHARDVLPDFVRSCCLDRSNTGPCLQFCVVCSSCEAQICTHTKCAHNEVRFLQNFYFLSDTALGLFVHILFIGLYCYAVTVCCNSVVMQHSNNESIQQANTPAPWTSHPYITHLYTLSPLTNLYSLLRVLMTFMNVHLC